MFIGLSEHILSWSILLSLIILAIYAMLSIKNEKVNFKEDSVPYSLAKVLFPIPYWWSPIEQGPYSLLFKRTDTHYEWFAKFSLIENTPNHKLEKLLDLFLEKESIHFDPETSIETKPAHLFKNQRMQDSFPSALRIEGKATQEGYKRIHLELYLFKDKESGQVYFCVSKSSVLNGLIEGPFFEEALYQSKLLDS